MTTKLILGDAIKELSRMESVHDLIVFDPDHEMPLKDVCLEHCWWASGGHDDYDFEGATLLFYGKNASTLIELLGDSSWFVRQLINLFLNGEKIGVLVVATDTADGSLDFPNLQEHNVDTKGADGHPTSKDASWLDLFLDTGRYNNVLDPFMGSAQWGVACQQRDIDYTGIEIDPEYFAMAEKNLGVRS